jgi:hypothetical protein
MKSLKNSCQRYPSCFWGFHQAYNAYRDGDFTLVDAERPDNNCIITIIAGPEKAKIQLPQILTCTMSPIIADMMQKALKQQLKKVGALEHVPRFKDELAVNGDENIFDSASHGQTRLRNPSLFLHDANPAAITALAHWLSNPQVSMPSGGEFQRMLLFDMTEKYHGNCKCGLAELRTSGTLSPSIYCAGHDPTVAISLICFAQEFQMTKLQHEITKGLLITCGIDQTVDKQLDIVRYPHSITFQRCIADKTNFRNAIQHFRLTVRKEAAKKVVTEMTGGKYEVSDMRKGGLEVIDGGIERKISFWGSFEVQFGVCHVSQS